MEIAHCTPSDYDQIVSQIHEFWGSDRTLYLHHPIFVYEFGNSAYVIRDRDHVVAYLFGLISQTEPTAYVHLVGVRASYRRRGLARRLYDRFVAFALSRGCAELKAVTTPGNQQSIAFHTSLGMEFAGNDRADQQGVHVVKDYAGPGQDRVVFRKPLRRTT
ncbi:MAG TPA: GNAT family N-acetyltransferase [Candidatus Binatia bacterium]|nr:GNAT family N-acetyltransferase [Candidatus Binatia bacterium]